MSVVLVTGATGLLGPYLVQAAEVFDTVVTTGRRTGIPADLTRPDEVRQLLRAVAPNIVVHAAALTDVDRCEREPQMADRLNRGTVSNLVAGLSRDTTLVVVSTDQVYPDRPGPHREGNEGPVNVYGRSKLAGELEAASHNRSLILRTNLFGPSRTAGRESLSDFVIRRLASDEGADLFIDVLFSPLHMTTLATLTLEAAVNGLTGVFNAGSRDGMSKYDFGLAVARVHGLDSGSARPARSDSVPSRAPRPHDLRLDVGKLEDSLGRVMPTLLEEVQKL